MSNKMLAKRLLATGMSVAMSATLFATNSITIFAEEGAMADIAVPEPISGEPSGDDSDAPAEFDFPTPEFNHEESEPETVWESEDGKYRVDVVEVTNSMDVYVSDMNSTDEEGNQSDEYQMVNKEDTEGQTLDYTDAITIVTMGDASVYLEDDNGDRVQVKTEEGEEVDLELPVGTTQRDLHEVQVVEKEDGSLHVLNGFDTFFNPVIYGYFDEEGKFIEGKEGDEGVQAYYKDKDEKFVAADTMYYTTKADGTRIYLTEEMYNAVVNGDSDVYTAKKEYEYNDQVYTEDEIKEVEKIKDVEDWSYVIAGDPEKIAEDYTTKYYERNANFYKKTVAGAPTSRKSYGVTIYTYPVNYYFKDSKGDTYVVERTEESRNGSIAVGTEFKLKEKGAVSSRVENIRKVTPATADSEPQKTVYYRVYSNDNPDEVLLELDEVAYENLRARNVALVDDKYAVRDKEGEFVLIDKEDYTIVTECEVVTNVATVNYYTVQDKYEKDPVEVDVTIGDATYKLSVNFWENDRIGITSVDLEDNGDGTVDVTVNFAYSQYRNGFWSEQEIGTGSVTRTVSAGTFGQDGTARMTIKYTPEYNRTNVPLIPEQTEEPDEREAWVVSEDQILRPVDHLRARVLADTGLAEASDVMALLAEYIEENPYATGYEPADLINWTFLRSEVNIGEPDVVISNNDVPETPSTPSGDETYPSGGETPFFFTTLAAAPGQVLGAQREETAANGAAVLGASRARGTADETTAPIARVLVMAAVAATALFLTRKKEENN